MCVGNDAGMPGSDAATVLSCSVLSGTWTSTFSINSGTTTSTGGPSPDPVSAWSTSLKNLVALDCAAGCTCNMTPASLPTCIASAAAACPDGSGIGVSAQNASDTAVFGYLQITNPDGTICAYDVTSSWVSP